MFPACSQYSIHVRLSPFLSPHSPFTISPSVCSRNANSPGCLFWFCRSLKLEQFNCFHHPLNSSSKRTFVQFMFEKVILKKFSYKSHLFFITKDPCCIWKKLSSFEKWGNSGLKKSVTFSRFHSKQGAGTKVPETEAWEP